MSAASVQNRGAFLRKAREERRRRDGPDLKRARNERLRREAVESLGAFARYATGGKYEEPPHIKLLIDKLEAVERGEIKRLIVSMPPRHGKSWLCSRFFPAWFLSRNPDKSVMLGSYAAGFAKKWGGRAREIIEQKGEEVFGVYVRGDTRAKDEWEIKDHEGGMKTDGVGGSFTGRGADLMVIDDPVKDHEQANSEVYREKVWDWYDTTAHSRLEPGAAVVVIMTRWHEDDLVGRLLKEEEEAKEEGLEGEGWEAVVLPAIWDGEGEDAIGRKKGEALWPKRFPAECKKFKRIKRRAYVWSALYQQKPTLPEGNLFKSSTFRYYKVIKDGAGESLYHYAGTSARSVTMQLFTTADFAFSEKDSACYTVVCVWGFFAGYLYLLDLHRGRYGKLELVKVYESIEEGWGMVRHWAEKGAYDDGMKTIDFLRSKGIRISIFGKDEGASKDKYARADSAQPWFEEGRVLFPQSASWLYTLIEELLPFPRGKFSDQVDAVSYGVIIAPWSRGDADPSALSKALQGQQKSPARQALDNMRPAGEATWGGRW